MGRSVLVPRGAQIVCYKDISEFGVASDEEQRGPLFDEWLAQQEFEDFLFEYSEHARRLWPSLVECDTFISREDRAVLENNLVYVGLSEYCGLLSLWVVPKYECGGEPETTALADRWISQIENKFLREFGELIKLGTMSNGEAVFKRSKN